MVAPHWQRFCDPEIRELAVMPEINGEDEDEVDVDLSGDDEGEDGAPS